jgi:multiple sugar transport system substrate-binding protein
MKRYLIAALALFVGVVVSIFPSLSQAEVDWRRFEGASITAIVDSGASSVAWLQPMANRFQEETGVIVRIEALPSSEYRKKQDDMFAAKDDSLDVITLQMDNRGGKLTAAGHLANLESYLADPEQTPANHDFPGDWLGGCLNTQKVIAGQLINNIVWSAQAQLLHIRKDLFQRYNVKVPTTLEELEEAAKKLTIDENRDGTPEVYGFLSRGSGRAITASFATYLWNHGGSWFRRDANGKKISNINSKEAIDAFAYYGRLIRTYAPPEAVNNNISANNALFAAGKVAMLSDLNYWTALFENPSESQVVGKTTTILVPRGPAGSYPNLPTTSLAISQYSKKKPIAYMFIMWMTQKHIMQLGQNNAVPMCRRSVWEDPSYQAPSPAWGKSAQIAAEYGIAIAKPQAIAIGEMRDAAAEVMHVAIKDGSRSAIQTVADRQAEIMDKLIEETEMGLEFRGALPEDAKLMPASEQILPIRAEGLDRLGNNGGT